MSYDRLITDGFLFTQTGVKFSILSADFGDGLEAAATIDSGLRRWTIKIDVLPDSASQVPLVDGQTRSEYLWNFFCASKQSGNYPFFIEDPKDGQFYLACFVDDELSYEVLCAKIYSTGLQLRQRRVRDQVSPIPSYPIIDVPGDVPDYGAGEYGG